MKTYRKLFAAAALLLLLCNTMQAQIIRRKTLKENEQLKAMVDSLKLQLDSCQEQLARFDSLGSEMMEVYEDEKVVLAEERSELSTDNLLSIWYLQRKMQSTAEDESYDMDSVRFTTDVPDSVLIGRLTRMNSYITLPFNETVKNYMVLYSEKMPTKMATAFSVCRITTRAHSSSARTRYTRTAHPNC